MITVVTHQNDALGKHALNVARELGYQTRLLQSDECPLPGEVTLFTYPRCACPYKGGHFLCAPEKPIDRSLCPEWVWPSLRRIGVKRLHSKKNTDGSTLEYALEVTLKQVAQRYS